MKADYRAPAAAWAALLLAAAPALAADTEAPHRDAHGDPLPAAAVARIGTVRLRHAGAVWTIAFSPDDKVLASAGEDYTVRLWDTATGKPLHVCRGHKNLVGALAFAPDGKRLVSAGWDGKVVLWSPATGAQARAFGRGPGHNALAVAFSRDGKSVRTCNDMIGPGVVAWDTADGKDRGAFRVPVGSNVRPAFSADGSLVTSADEANVFRVWDTATGTLQLQLPKHKDKVYGAAFSPDGRYLATGGRTNPVHLWELATGGLVRTLPATGDHVFAFTPDGRALVSAGDNGTAHVWALATGKELRRFRAPWRARALVLSHDGRTLAAAGQEGVIGLWDFATGKPKVPAAESPAGLVPLAFLPGGKRLAVGWGSGLAVWQIDGPPREARRLETIDRPLALSADGKLALAGQSYQGTYLWDVEAGVELRKFGERDHRAWAAFAPDGKTLALVASGEAALWDVNTGKVVRRLGKPRSFRGSVAFSPDGKVLAMLGEAESVLRFWETATGKLQQQATIPAERFRHWYNSSLTFTPDGRVLAVADWNGAQLFDVAAGRFTHKLPTGVVAFSPDGKLIAGGGHDGVIRLWEVATGKPVGELHGHEGRVTGLRFSPDGRLLASGAADHTILLWDVRRAK